MADEEEVQEFEELETERERVAKEEQPRLPQDELEAQLVEELQTPVEPNPDEPEPEA